MWQERFGETLFTPVAQRAEEANKLGRLSAEDVRDLHQSGYTRLSLPREYGGDGASLADCLSAQVALAQANPSTALVAGMQLQVFGHARELRSWPEDRFARLCAEAQKGGLLCNSLATERELGSPSRGQFYKTKAEFSADGQQLIINGHKTWATGGQHLTHLLVKLSFAPDDVGVVIVPQNTQGVRWEETWRDVLSFRASDSHDLFLEDVTVSAENLLERGTIDKRTNVWFPLIMTSIYLGVGLAARHAVVRYALERVPTALGQPIATLPKIQRQIGEIDVQLQAAQALLFEVAREWVGREEDRPHFLPRIASAKTVVTEAARVVTDKALQIAGGASLTQALPLERYFRDARAGEMQPPSGDTALELIGRAALSSLS